MLMASTSTSGNSSPDLQHDSKYNDSVYIFHIPDGDPKAEIIFFHDIEWEGCEEPHVQTWMSNSNPQVCWPKDWLSADYPQARILSACYDAGKRKTKNTGHMTFPLLAGNLRQDILSIYEYGCPVFLVGHGLGGLVIRGVIREMQQRRDDLARLGSIHWEDEVKRLDCFLKNVKGILDYDTPFSGTEVADKTRKDLRSRGSMWVYLEQLRAESGVLNEWFRLWRSTKSCKALSILAGLPTNTHGHVVTDASARNGGDDLYSSHKDHFSVCMPHSKTDNSFLMLKRLVEAQGIALGPVPQVDHSDESECTKLVNDSLKELKTLRERRQALHLDGYVIEKIRKFPTLLDILTDGLRQAGFAKTAEHAYVESWELL